GGRKPDCRRAEPARPGSPDWRWALLSAEARKQESTERTRLPRKETPERFPGWRSRAERSRVRRWRTPRVPRLARLMEPAGASRAARPHAAPPVSAGAARGRALSRASAGAARAPAPSAGAGRPRAARAGARGRGPDADPGGG